jgi:serine/threonine protein kinase
MRSAIGAAAPAVDDPELTQAEPEVIDGATQLAPGMQEALTESAPGIRDASTRLAPGVDDDATKLAPLDSLYTAKTELNTGLFTGGESALLGGRYSIEKTLGAGGFGEVYLGRDLRLDKAVAIKRLRADKLSGHGGEKILQRFHNEAKAIARLDHPNIVRVNDYNRDDDGFYIVMNYIDGGSLKDYLEANDDKLRVPEALQIAMDVARGLFEAHKHKLVHRDVKPANIMLKRDGNRVVAKLVDFGLARVSEIDDSVSETGIAMGTPVYMPPEQKRDAKNVDHRADIYSLGKVLYRMVAGLPPDDVDPSLIPPPVELSAIITRCIKTRPRDRYFSIADLITDMERIIRGGDSVSVMPSTRKMINENICPKCQLPNDPDDKFCASPSCGAALTFVCSECGTENTVHRSVCRMCGTDAALFERTLETWHLIQELKDDRNWKQIVVECERLPTTVKLMQAKGKELLSSISDMKDRAVRNMSTLEELKEKIDSEIESKNYQSAMALVAKCQKIAPNQSSIQELPDKLRYLDLGQEFGEKFGEIEELESARKLEKARDAVDKLYRRINQFETPSNDAEWGREYRRNRKRLEEFESTLDATERKISGLLADASLAIKKQQFEECEKLAGEAVGLNAEAMRGAVLLKDARAALAEINERLELAKHRRAGKDWAGVIKFCDDVLRIQQHNAEANSLRLEAKRTVDSGRVRVRMAIMAVVAVLVVGSTLFLHFNREQVTELIDRHQAKRQVKEAMAAASLALDRAAATPAEERMQHYTAVMVPMAVLTDEANAFVVDDGTQTQIDELSARMKTGVFAQMKLLRSRAEELVFLVDNPELDTARELAEKARGAFDGRAYDEAVTLAGQAATGFKQLIDEAEAHVAAVGTAEENYTQAIASLREDYETPSPEGVTLEEVTETKSYLGALKLRDNIRATMSQRRYAQALDEYSEAIKLIGFAPAEARVQRKLSKVTAIYGSVVDKQNKLTPADRIRQCKTALTILAELELETVVKDDPKGAVAESVLQMAQDIRVEDARLRVEQAMQAAEEAMVAAHHKQDQDGFDAAADDVVAVLESLALIDAEDIGASLGKLELQARRGRRNEILLELRTGIFESIDSLGEELHTASSKDPEELKVLTEENGAIRAALDQAAYANAVALGRAAVKRRKLEIQRRTFQVAMRLFLAEFNTHAADFERFRPVDHQDLVQQRKSVQQAAARDQFDVALRGVEAASGKMKELIVATAELRREAEHRQALEDLAGVKKQFSTAQADADDALLKRHSAEQLAAAEALATTAVAAEAAGEPVKAVTAWREAIQAMKTAAIKAAARERANAALTAAQTSIDNADAAALIEPARAALATALQALDGPSPAELEYLDETQISRLKALRGTVETKRAEVERQAEILRASREHLKSAQTAAAAGRTPALAVRKTVAELEKGIEAGLSVQLARPVRLQAYGVHFDFLLKQPDLAGRAELRGWLRAAAAYEKMSVLELAESVGWKQRRLLTAVVPVLGQQLPPMAADGAITQYADVLPPEIRVPVPDRDGRTAHMTFVLHPPVAAVDGDIQTPVYVAANELLHGQYRVFADLYDRPSFANRMSPVGDMSLGKAIEYCNWLSAAHSIGSAAYECANPDSRHAILEDWDFHGERSAFRLPTESEWDAIYSLAKGGTAWLGAKASGKPAEPGVVDIKPGPTGIYLMDGNVSELVSDLHGKRVKREVVKGGDFQAQAPTRRLLYPEDDRRWVGCRLILPVPIKTVNIKLAGAQ